MSKSFICGFIVGVVLLIVVGVGASRLQNKIAIPTSPQEKEYQTEAQDATPVVSGLLSEKQRIHSRLYQGYLESRGWKTISGLVAQANGKSRVIGTELLVGLGPVLTEPETPELYFGRLMRESDAVILGRVSSKVSQITEDDAFIFTDYDVLVEEILKNNKAAQINLDTTIGFTSPGGKVLLDGVVVNAKDDSLLPLPDGNYQVLLFLKFIPETGAYKATRDTGIFELGSLTAKPLTKSQFPPGALRAENSFMQTIRALVSK